MSRTDGKQSFYTSPGPSRIALYKQYPYKIQKSNPYEKIHQAYISYPLGGKKIFSIYFGNKKQP